MLPECLKSTAALRREFVAGLKRQLEQPKLGSFILVLANAVYDQRIYAELSELIWQNYDRLAANYKQLLASGRPLPDAPDDVLVFLKLMAIGPEGVRFNESRVAGRWQVQFNQLRAFRPTRMAGNRIETLQAPFDRQRFHFNKAFLEREILWQGKLHQRTTRLLYNKFPFAPLHGLLVIEPEREQPQLLTEADHHYAWELMLLLGRNMPDIGLGYNAYGAYASVNHQHFQSYIMEPPGMPIEYPDWQHNGGLEPCPIDCLRIDDASVAWTEISRLHHSTQSYNLLYRPGRLYIQPRAFQGSFEHANWTAGFAWSELAGAITCFNREDYEGLQEVDINEEFAKLRG